MRAKGDDRHKMTAAILNKELGYSQKKIADLMEVEQSTISTWIQIGTLLLQNRQLAKIADSLRNQLAALGYTPQKVLDNKLINEII